MNRSFPFIYILGAGNVATRLGSAVARRGFCIRGLWARRKESALELSASLNAVMDEVFSHSGTEEGVLFPCVVFDDLETLVKDAANRTSLVFFCVSDDAVPSLADFFTPYGRDVCCVHTVGNLPMRVFEGVVEHYGVLYPLQTLSKGHDVDFSQVPLFVEGSDEVTERMLEGLARELSQTVQRLDSEKRKNLHLSAVFACNFPNALFGISERLLADVDVERSMLEPLIKETVEKFLAKGATASQTGPAARGDLQVMARQTAMLVNKPDVCNIYNAISAYIRNQRTSGDG